MNRDAALLFYALQNERAFDRLHEVMAPDCQLGVPGPGRGPGAFAAFARNYVDAFPDLSYDVLETVCEGEQVAVLSRNSGTHQGVFLGHPPTGRRFAVMGMDLLRYREGRMVERKGVFDTVTMLHQLGLYR
jgi:predicted ester cyclase